MTANLTTGDTTATGRRVLPFAIGFLALFIGGDIVTGMITDDALPRPDDPKREVYDYFVANASASIAAGTIQIVSALCLAGFVTVLARRMSDTRFAPWGWVSAGLYAACGALSYVMAAVAPDVSVDTLVLIRDINFYTGGVAHVVTLGVFTVLVSRAEVFGRGVRRFGAIAGGLAIASIISPLVYYANAFLPIGRVTCMIWAISAAVSLIRHRKRVAVEVA